MTLASQEKLVGSLALRSPGPMPDLWQARAYTRLSAVYATAREIPFDNTSRIVFFSDCHRGDNSKADAFAANEALYLTALKHYYHRGFNYIEVGDGDELWKNVRFSQVLHAHRRTFDMLHQFDAEGRLHIVLGNHDISGQQRHRVDKDGIIAEEGLILHHAQTGQRLFVVHGHQADFKSDELSAVSRLMVRHVWRRLQLLGFSNLQNHFQDLKWRLDSRTAVELLTWLSQLLHAKKQIERRIISWIAANRQTLICGHTHRPMFAGYGTPPYFNTGSCVIPGTLTGLELQDGALTLVQWSARPGAKAGQALEVKRAPLAPSRKLCQLPVA